MASGGGSTGDIRRHHLSALGYELAVRGLNWRLIGHDGMVLHVVHPATGRAAMVVAVPSSASDWSYLWSAGGTADVTDPSRAAVMIASQLNPYR